MEPELDFVGAVISAILAKLEGVWTTLPAQVTAVDGQLVTCKPTVLDVDGRPLPSTVGVRVVQPLAGTLGVAVPVSVGCEGLLVCCTLDPSSWMLRSGVTAQQTTTRHALSYGVFLPGIGPSAPNMPEKPTIGDMSHTAHPIALGDRLTQILMVLDAGLRAPSPTPTDPNWAALKTTWTNTFPVLPSVESTDAEVTSS